MIVDETNANEANVYNWSAWASDLGIKPGQWPVQLDTTLGSGMPFIARRKEERDGDLLSVTYHQANGCLSLKVYND